MEKKKQQKPTSSIGGKGRMSYQPKTWENKPSTASPINATNLNHMEGGIKTNDDNIVDAQNAILTLQGEMLQAQGDISALETLVDSIFPIDTESGNPAVIPDAFGGACKSLKLTLEPIQSGSGTPSPQNVRPISGRTQSIITKTGKNVCSSAYVYNGTGQYATVLYCDGDLKPNTTYTFSFVTNSGNTYYTNDNVFASTVVVSGTGNRISFTATTKSTLAKVAGQYIEGQGYMILKNSISQPNTPSFTDVQVEVGSTATTYEPYTGETITIQLGQTVYGGVLDVTSGVLTMNKVGVDMGGLEWTYQNTAGRFYIDLADLLPPTSDSIAFSGSASNCKVVASNRRDVETDPVLFVFAGQNRVYSKNFTDTSLEAFQTTMNGQILCYELAAPVSIPLTAQNITLLHGDNVLTTDADSIEASYSADIALYIEKKIAEGSQNNRSLSKGGSSDEESKEEEKEEVKEEEIEIKEAEPLTKEVR
jgi:hypothetical protein